MAGPLLLLHGITSRSFTPRAGRIRVDVYNAGGTQLNYGAITTVLGFEYTLELDAIGSFTAEFPAADEKVGYLAIGYELRFYREGEGLVFRGLIDRIESAVRGDERVARVAGSSIARQLVWANTLLAKEYSGAALSSVVSAAGSGLLVGTGWTAGSLDVPVTTLLARYDGVSVWRALQDVAEKFRLHLREDPLNKQVDVGAFGTSSGLTLQNVGQARPEIGENTTLFPIAGELQVTSEAAELWNRVIVLGGGEGINQLTLRYSSRASPYTIQSATGPDGQTYYYLEDATSVAAYGARTKVLVFKDAVPLALSAAGLQAAANALYDVGATWLQRHKDPPTEYAASVLGLRHIASGTPAFEVGQKIRLVYHGVTQDQDGTRRAWLTVDASVWVLGFTRSFRADGSDDWRLKLSTVDRVVSDDLTQVAEALEDLDSIKVATRPFTLERPYRLERTSIQSPGSPATNNAKLLVKFDANIGNLHYAKLAMYVRALRSNVATTTDESAHQHIVANFGNANTSTTGSPSATTTVVTSASASGTATAITGLSTASVASSGHSHGLAAHIHTYDPTLGTAPQNTGASNPNTGDANVSTTTVVTGSSSTASVVTGISTSTASVGSSTHTHSTTTRTVALSFVNSGGSTVSGSVDVIPVSLPGVFNGSSWLTQTLGTGGAHSHGLTYGIFADPSPPGTPAVSLYINGVDRSAALGGPWSTYDTEIAVDVTAYLQTATGVTGQPLQQVNTLEFRCGSGAVDVEAELRALITMWSLVPV